jgi:hypothetical protein
MGLALIIIACVVEYVRSFHGRLDIVFFLNIVGAPVRHIYDRIFRDIGYRRVRSRERIRCKAVIAYKSVCHAKKQSFIGAAIVMIGTGAVDQVETGYWGVSDEAGPFNGRTKRYKIILRRGSRGGNIVDVTASAVEDIAGGIEECFIDGRVCGVDKGIEANAAHANSGV